MQKSHFDHRDPKPSKLGTSTSLSKGKKNHCDHNLISILSRSQGQQENGWSECHQILV
jgi:hypothetical protein